MPAAKPPPRKPAPTLPAKDAGDGGEGAGFAGDRAEAEGRSIGERTDPGGPSPAVLAKARRDKVDKGVAAPVQPGPGDATLVYDKNKGHARGPAEEAPRLLVTAGPRKGTE